MNEKQRKEAVDKARRFAELQAKIQKRAQILSSLPKQSSATNSSSSSTHQSLPRKRSLSPIITTEKPQFVPAPSIKIDEHGRVVDSSGRALEIPKIQPIFKANARARSQRQNQHQNSKQLSNRIGESSLFGNDQSSGYASALPSATATGIESIIPEGIESTAGLNPYFDERLQSQSIGIGAGSRATGRKTFQFNPQGKYTEKANKLRAQNQLAKLKEDIAAATKKSGISSATKLALLATNKDDSSRMPIPDVEWWDLAVKGDGKGDDGKDGNVAVSNVTSLIEHPIIVEIEQIKSKNVEMPVYLTKKEKKKMRTQRRREIEKDKQEQIRAGLIEPDAPRLTMANFMRAMKDEAIQDPSKIEADVRAQMEERQRRHEEANASRKLTAEERGEKKRRKLLADVGGSIASTGGGSGGSIHVALFRVRNLGNPKHRYKVDINAKEFMFTGCMVIHGDTNVVAVEGGPKGLRKFKKLMLHRIRWTEGARVATAAAAARGEKWKRWQW